MGLELIKANGCEWRDASGFGGTGSASKCFGEKETSCSRQTKCNEPNEPQKITCQRNYIRCIRRGKKLYLILYVKGSLRLFQVHFVNEVLRLVCNQNNLKINFFIKNRSSLLFRTILDYKYKCPNF